MYGIDTIERAHTGTLGLSQNQRSGKFEEIQIFLLRNALRFLM